MKSGKSRYDRKGEAELQPEIKNGRTDKRSHHSGGTR